MRKKPGEEPNLSEPILFWMIVGLCTLHYRAAKRKNQMVTDVLKG